MGITVTGLGSGLDYDSWIEALVAVKQTDIDAVSSKIKAVEENKTTLNSIESSYSSLLDSIKSFTTTISKNNVFNQKTVTSSSDSVKADVTAYTKTQDVNVTVSQLATATTAQSSTNVTSYIDEDTKISDIVNSSIKAGTFSIYINGVKSEVSVTSDMTIGEVIDTINNSSDFEGVTASLSSDGKLTIASDNPTNYKVTLGSSSDTSNFLNVMSMTGSNSSYTSSKSLSDTNTTTALTSSTYANGNVTAGYFTIGNASFEITSSTTIDDIINKINKSSDAGATAYWDSTAGKLMLTSTDQGATNINVAAGSASDTSADKSNFLYIMGLTKSDGTTLADNSQTLGQNAILTVNGTTITSSSNTVTSDVTGITGLTLTLNATTSSTARVSVASDNSKVEESLQTFVDALNKVISSTDTATGTAGDLFGESILKSLRNKLRNLTTAKVDDVDSTYNVLAKIGITSKLTKNSDGSKSTSFELDPAVLKTALEDDPDAVQALLTGEGTSKNGVLNKLQTVVDDALDAADGYFTTKEASLDKQVGRFEDKVERMTDSLDKYRERLEAKFAAMDTLISSLEKSASIFDSYFNKDSNDS